MSSFLAADAWYRVFTQTLCRNDVRFIQQNASRKHLWEPWFVGDLDLVFAHDNLLEFLSGLELLLWGKNEFGMSCF